MDWFASFQDNRRKFVVPSVSLKDKTGVPTVFTVYPDFKYVCVEFIDNNLGDISTSTVHKHMNTCLKVIIDHDTIFIDIDSDSEEEWIGKKEGMLDSMTNHLLKDSVMLLTTCLKSRKRRERRIFF
eukprot:6499139-Ditylum_brightwellii.AAC.1